MRAGDLDRLVRIEQNIPTRDPSGAALDSWTLLAEEWARRLDGRGRELFAARQVTAEAVTAWRLRWREDVRPAMRIVDGADMWDIEFVAEIGGRREGLDLGCIKRDA